MNTKDKLLITQMLLSFVSGFSAIYLGITHTGPVSVAPYMFIIMIMQILIFFAYRDKDKDKENDCGNQSDNNDEKRPLIEIITEFYITIVAMPYSYYMMIIFLIHLSEKYA